MKKILVIAPHPDDEVLGCGGTIARHSKQGDKVYLCVVTKAYAPDWSEEFLKNRPKEVAKSNRVLGIKKTYFLDFPTVKLDTVPQKQLNDAIFKVIEEVKPETIYIPNSADLNKDHCLVFEAAMFAAKPRLNFSVKRILCYETLSETEWGVAPQKKLFIPNVYIDIFDTLKEKIEAMKAYKSEIKKCPHPRSLEIIKVLARKRGSEAVLKFAEAFMLIREIN